MKTVRDATLPLTETQIAEKLSSENLDELLQLWRTEQGVAKRRDLELMAAALPFQTDANLRVLDMCCGPGDVGRSIWDRYRNARIDCVDRDVFLISICNGINRREGVPAENFVRDLWNTDWHNGLPHDYDVVATANALHWFDAPRLVKLFNDSFQLLRPGGVFLFVEPACAEKTFAAGFAEWKSRQPARYSRENWERFWMRANEILGYDHTKFLGSRDSNRISDEMPVSGWIRLLENAGFDSIDVLLRVADVEILASSKPPTPRSFQDKRSDTDRLCGGGSELRIGVKSQH
jgi:SAM-dependent methyltransferase